MLQEAAGPEGACPPMERIASHRRQMSAQGSHLGMDLDEQAPFSSSTFVCRTLRCTRFGKS